MRFRLGLAIGFGVGYYLGTAAGRERHEEIQRLLGRVKRSDAYESATDKAREVIDLGVDKAKDTIADLRRDDDPETAAAKAAASGNGTSVPAPPPFPDARP